MIKFFSKPPAETFIKLLAYYIRHSLGPMDLGYVVFLEKWLCPPQVVCFLLP